MHFLVSILLLGAGPSDAPKVLRKPSAEYAPPKIEPGSRFIPVAALSADGKFLARAASSGVAVFKIGETEPLFVTDPDLGAGKPVFSADGKLIAFAAAERNVHILSVPSGKAQASFKVPGTVESVDNLAFSPDGKHLAVSSGVLYHKDLRIFDAATGKLLGTPLEDVDGLAHQLVYSADGKRLIANHYFKVFIVDAASFRLESSVSAKGVPLVFFEGAKLLAVPVDSGSVHEVVGKEVSAKPAGQFADKLDHLTLMRTSVAGSPALAAIPQGKDLSVRNTNGREVFRIVGAASAVKRAHLSADTRVLLIERESNALEVFRLE